MLQGPDKSHGEKNLCSEVVRNLVVCRGLWKGHRLRGTCVRATRQALQDKRCKTSAAMTVREVPCANDCSK